MDKIYYIPTIKRIMSITFDDGVEPHTDPIILNILKNYNIKATFFVLIDNVIKYPDILKRVISEGHLVGLHGINHTSFNKYPKRKIYHHIKRGIDILHNSFGVRIKYHRPPFGTFPIGAEIVCKEFNLVPCGWSNMERDYQPRWIEAKSDNIIKKSLPGSILTLHDGYRCLPHPGVTIEILKNILPKLIAQGYSFVSIPELVANKSNMPHKTFSNIPLLHQEVIDYNDKTILFLYWDINAIKSNEEYFILRIIEKNKIIMDTKIKLPSPWAMEEWTEKIVFPLNAINKDSEIFIKNKEIFVKI